MNRLIYNLCMTTGVALGTAGAGLEWGGGVAMIVCGALLVVLTIISALMSD